MLRMLGNPRRFCDGVTRREALTAGALSHCLGIDPDTPIADRAGRAIPIAHGGEPIREVLA